MVRCLLDKKLVSEWTGIDFLLDFWSTCNNLCMIRIVLELTFWV